MNDVNSPRSLGRTGLFVLLAGAVVVGTLVAWVVWPRDSGQVLVVGDSVTFLAAESIKDEIGRDGLTIRAYPGDRSTQLLTVLIQEVQRREESGGLDRVAVLAGYNDVLRDTEHPEDLAKMVDLSSRFECAVFLTVPAPPKWANRPAETEPFAALNDRLAKAVSAHPNVHLSTVWAEAVAASSPGDLVSDDGVHPIEHGKLVLGKAFADALRENC
ncbi:MAG: SGNH/GDSL hydrolase family protein [Aquihabitans sp.]